MKKIEEMNHYEILGLSPDSTTKEIQDAYMLSVSTFSEYSIASYSLISEEEKRNMLSRIENAYRTLNNPPKRTLYNEEILKIPFSGDSTPKVNETPPLQRPAPLQKNNKNKKSLFSFPWLREKKNQKETEISTQTGSDIITISGAFLRNIRELKRISVKEVSEETRIKMTFITAIENDTISEHMSEIFSRGFIKSYAGFLGLDPDQISRSYQLKK